MKLKINSNIAWGYLQAQAFRIYAISQTIWNILQHAVKHATCLWFCCYVLRYLGILRCCCTQIHTTNTSTPERAEIRIYLQTKKESVSWNWRVNKCLKLSSICISVASHILSLSFSKRLSYSRYMHLIWLRNCQIITWDKSGNDNTFRIFQAIMDIYEHLYY